MLATDTFQSYTANQTLQTSAAWTKVAGNNVAVVSNGGTAPTSTGVTTDLRPEFGSFAAFYRYNSFTRAVGDSFTFAFDVNPGVSNVAGDSVMFLLSVNSAKEYVALGINDQSDTIYRVTGDADDIFGSISTTPLMTGFNPATAWQTVSGSWNAANGELTVTWADTTGGSKQVISSLGVSALAGPNVGIAGKFAGTSYIDNLNVTTGGSFGTPPIVDAGGDQRFIIPGGPFQLTGLATDDGAISSVAWTQVTGPTTATLSNANTPVVSLSNLAVGVYEFSLTATDDQGLSRSDTVAVTIVPVGDYNSDNRVTLADEQVWRTSFGLVGANLPADGNQNGEVDAADYTTWRDNYVPAPPSSVVLYPAPNLTASNQYSVQVLIDGVWTTSYVNFDTARTSGSGSTDEPGKTFSWTTFETSAPVTVRVKRLEGTFNTAVVRPSRHGLATTKVAPDTVEFTVEPGQKVSVEFDTEIKENCYTGEPYGLDCIKDIMMIFADEPQPTDPLAGVPASDIFYVTPGNHFDLMNVSGGTGLTAGKSTLGTAGGKKVAVFAPGVYDIGYWQVPNNVERVHISGGAVVFGAIDVIPQGRSPFYDAATINTVYRDNWRNQTLRSSFTVDGTGILSGSRLPWHLKKDFTYTAGDDWWAHVKVLQAAATNFTVKGVTLADSPHWTLSFINDDDDRVTGVFDNFKMVAAWTYNNDGLPNGTGANSRISNAFIHADDDAIKIYNSGGKVENVVIWQSNNGAAFQFGWFAKSLSNVTISDIDIIHFENWYGVNQVNRAVFNYANAGGSGTIQNVTFNDVNVEGQVLRLFGFNITSGTQQIKNITFNNLKSGGMGVGNLGAPGRNYFLGNITNFTFNNFEFGGQVVTNAAQAQFDFGNGAGGGFTFTSPASSAMSLFQLDASEGAEGVTYVAPAVAVGGDRNRTLLLALDAAFADEELLGLEEWELWPTVDADESEDAFFFGIGERDTLQSEVQ